MKELAVVIGRFQPFHNGHIALIDEALKYATNVLILIGSSNAAPTVKNPFSYIERRAIMSNYYKGRNVFFAPLKDYLYSDLDWCNDVQAAVENQSANLKDEDVILVGHNKDESSYYMNLFPQWDVVDVNPHTGEGTDVINATDIRNEWFQFDLDIENDPRLPLQSRLMMDSFMFEQGEYREEFNRLTDEYEHLQNYKELWKAAPFPPTFVTSDAVVVCGGHILLIKRKFAPGKGLYALPGGFTNQNERIEDSMLRELKEETRIKVHKNVLRGSIKNTRVFDAPGRSLRGRTITHASLIVLNGYHGLPAVKGGDDAEEVGTDWVPLSKFYQMEREMFEDHFHIACNLIGSV